MVVGKQLLKIVGKGNGKQQIVKGKKGNKIHPKNKYASTTLTKAV
jgi:hypothetical protein